MNRVWAAAGVAVALMAQGASAQDTGELAVTVDKVRSGDGTVQGILCADKTVTIPTACATYRAQAKAVAGATTLTFTGVKPGDYAVQIYHDENGNGRPDIPPEGYGYGNDAPYPTTFDRAAVKVAGATQTKLNLVYLSAGPPAPAMGSKGAPAPAGIIKIDVREKGLYAEFYVPSSARPLPAIILFGGSEGGLDTMSGMAVSFAKQGYATLVLAYWAEQGLPKTLERIPLEYFDQATAWVKARPEVDKTSIGALGWSRGSEAVMLLGARNKDIHAVVAIAPSSMVWSGIDWANIAANENPAWTAGGKPMPFVRPDAAAYRPNQPMNPIYIRSFPEAQRRPETMIPAEKINGPLLLISGLDDRLWPSSQFADQIVARLQGAKFKHGVEHLAYPGAGHTIFVGEPNGIMAKQFAAPNAMMGGTPAANAAAWADNWPKTVAFFDKALKGARR